ncbi:MAG: ScpA family protein [Syntrophales bacterium]
MSYEIKLDIFEGPLDLLLYLIKKNEVDIYNIPIAVITEQYLQHIDAMKSLNLDVAGEYLVMASTLLLIKSRMLLPVEEEDGATDETDDPRTELVKQLLEYQTFKEAALNLERRNLLGRDVFKREMPADDSDGDEEHYIELNIFDLIEAFRRTIANMRKEDILEIDAERISLSDRINEILEQLHVCGDVIFTDLLGDTASRKRIIYTLLAILELVKLRIVRAYQVSPFGPIRIFLAVQEEIAEAKPQDSDVEAGI